MGEDLFSARRMIGHENIAYFTQDPPARSCVQVVRIPRDALIEIAAVAVK